MKKIQVINGPNLNMFGKREPEIYGSETLADIEKQCKKESAPLEMSIEFWQSNSETDIIEKIQAAFESDIDGIVINAAAYTHTSIGIADALSMLSQPIIEVHMSNVYSREEFRHKSYISAIAKGVICGFKGQGYILALHAMKNLLKDNT